MFIEKNRSKICATPTESNIYEYIFYKHLNPLDSLQQNTQKKSK